MTKRHGFLSYPAGPRRPADGMDGNGLRFVMAALVPAGALIAWLAWTGEPNTMEKAIAQHDTGAEVSLAPPPAGSGNSNGAPAARPSRATLAEHDACISGLRLADALKHAKPGLEAAPRSLEDIEAECAARAELDEP